MRGPQERQTWLQVKTQSPTEILSGDLPSFFYLGCQKIKGGSDESF